MIFYTKDFFDNISHNGSTMNLLLGVMNMVGGILGVPLIAAFGRRFNLIASSLFMSIAMAIMGVGVSMNDKYVCMIAVMLYMLNFAYGLGGTLAVYTAEIVPPLGVGFATAVQWMFSAIIAKVTPIILQNFGAVFVCVMFSTNCLIGFIAIFTLVIETKGKTKDQIEKSYEFYRLPMFGGGKISDSAKVAE